MNRSRSITGLALAAGLVLAFTGCDNASDAEASSLDFPSDGAGKTDILGRDLVGVASPYEPDPRLADPEVAEELDLNVRARRDQAWVTIQKALEPVPLLGLAEAAAEHEDVADVLPEDIPKVPRFQTWYGTSDMRRMIGALYEGLEPGERLAKAAFSDDALEDIEAWNAGALDRSQFWPLERFLKNVENLGNCPEELSAEDCAIEQQSKFSGSAGGIARIGYSPGTTLHILGNYAPILECLETLDTVSRDLPLEDDRNFTHCFEEEFPADVVLIKAQWARVGFGNDDIPVFDTSAEALGQRLAPTASADWGDLGDRRANPGPEDIYTIKLRTGAVFRLTGLHIMTKELRHWQWITMWWSDTPDEDFGADRPADVFDELPGYWSNYKMCAVTAYVEGDEDPAARYPDHPSLAEALSSTAELGGPTWCSNPYIEHGRGNARTNCIGCHQHGGATVDLDWDEDGVIDPLDLEKVIDDEEKFPRNGRLEHRSVFPADYLWSFSRIDDFAHLIKGEIERVDFNDANELESRIKNIIQLDADPARGEPLFRQRCGPCHGVTGAGSGFAPSLQAQVPTLDDQSMMKTILLGRNDMPPWGDFFNERELADIRAFMRDSFGAPEE